MASKPTQQTKALLLLVDAQKRGCTVSNVELAEHVALRYGDVLFKLRNKRGFDIETLPGEGKALRHYRLRTPRARIDWMGPKVKPAPAEQGMLL
jgi:hypothetical protein